MVRIESNDKLNGVLSQFGQLADKVRYEGQLIVVESETNKERDEN